jgi:hypothetical protein
MSSDIRPCRHLQHQVSSQQNHQNSEIKYPGEAIELGLVSGRQLPMHGSQRRLLTREFFVEIAGIGTSILRSSKVSANEAHEG